MSWLSTVESIIAVALSGSRRQRFDASTGLKSARISYINQGRAGKVVFTQGMTSFEMYFEFSGGDTVATIDIPPTSDWVARTGISLAMRRSVLEFIGHSVVRDQTAGGRGRYHIHDHCISIHA